MLLDEDLAKHPQYAPKIRSIAEYVDARCNCLATAHVPFDDADNYQLPNEDEIRQWVRALQLPIAAFPGGGRI
jgi:hypothetical protein